MKVVIIGGVAGGATAAARLRRLDEAAEIIILERSGFVSYANCGLPYYIGGVIEQKEALTLQSPESFRNRFHIDVRVRSEALSIDPEKKTVLVKRLDDGTEYAESYDKLILSPGAKAIVPPFPGVDSSRVMTVRTVEDTYRVREFVEEKKPRRAVVVGGGFIGLEVAENLMEAGIQVSLVQLDDQVMLPFDYDMACQMHSYVRSQGLDLHLSTSVTGFAKKEDGITVFMKSAAQNEELPALEADLVIMAVGVVPESGLAKEAGLQLGIKGAIVVNEQMQTSAPDIYAVGDAVEVTHYVTGQKALVSLAGPANKQGRIAADHICGRQSSFAGAQGSSVIKLFDMTAAATGINEKQAKSLGLSYDKVITYSNSHASYYPGATGMTIKTIYEKESGRILGAQIVGFDGVDKRLDVLATAIRARMTAADLEELELAYAPPYSSAKDPVNMAGFVIENVRSGLVRQYHWEEAGELAAREDCTILDVRTREEFAGGHIPGAVNIPLDELREHLNELDTSKELYVNCYSGLRSYLACRILGQNGFSCRNLAGGYRFYEYIATDRAYDDVPTHPCGLRIQYD